LELHWDIAHPHFTLDTGVGGFWSRLLIVRIGDATLPSLSPADLLFTLIVHGTRHAWSRMMWLVDVAELLRRKPAINWGEFWSNASSRGAGRMMATGLVLAKRALGLSALNGPAEVAHSDEAAAALGNRVIARWNEDFDAATDVDLEPTALWRHRWIMHTRESRLQRWAYARNVMMTVGEEEFGAVTLPGTLGPLYKLVRFWNVFRRARPRARSASAPSKG
jgi:hypothetical protein